MAHIRLSIVDLAVLLVLATTGLGFAQEADQCSLAPIIQPLDMSAPAGQVLPDSLEMRFVVADYPETIGGTTVYAKVVVPSLDLRSDITSFVGAKLVAMEQAIREEVDRNKLDFAGWSVATIEPQGEKLLIKGDITVRKYAKFDWVCCQWFKCGRCRKEIRLFQRTVPFSATITRSIASVPIHIYSKVLQEVGERLRTVTSPADYPTKLDLGATGKTEGGTSVLEDLYDFIAGFLEFINERLFGGEAKWQMKDWISQTFNKDFDGPNPHAFQQSLFTFAHSQQDNAASPRPVSQRWFWQSFVAGLKLNNSRTIFTAVGGKNKFTSAFNTSYRDYTRYLNHLGLGRGGIVVDYLVYDSFCKLGGREVLEDFMASLKKEFEKKDTGPKDVEVPRGQLAQEIRKHFGAWGLDEYMKSAQRLSRSSDGKSWIMHFPELSAVSSSRTLTAINSNLWAMDAEQGWSRVERRCIDKLALKRSGSLNKIYPSQDFSECLDEPRSLSADQERAIDAVGAQGEVYTAPAAVGFGPPIAGGSNYRGWYYCYRTSSLCAGKQRIIWTQKESMFSARGGRHGGVDIFDSNGDDENISIAAVTDGKLIYNNLDPTEWGHALILPFKKQNKSYYAVYAHLPAGAKSMDGKSVKLGDNIGVAGCSGNAGDGKGICNNYCVVNGGGRSDIHLHFETIEIADDGTRKKVDPTAVLNFTPVKNSDVRLYACDQKLQVSRAGSR